LHFIIKENLIKLGNFQISIAHVLGTPVLIPPEICKGETYDMKGDIW